MKYLLTITLLFFSFALSAQEKQEDAPKINVYSSALPIGGILSFGDKSLKFKEVVSDSRCPKDVTCVWAGEAKVRVEVFENGSLLEEKIILINSGEIALNFSAEDIVYSISGMTLSPYPTVKTKDTPKEYILQMRVSEKL